MNGNLDVETNDDRKSNSVVEVYNGSEEFPFRI